MGIGRRIKEARIAKGLTQEDLAKAIGITKGAIANYENETSHPKEPVMYALIDTLDVDANFLFQDCVKAKKAPSMSDEAMKIAKDYDSLDSRGKDLVQTVVSKERMLSESTMQQATVPTPRIIDSTPKARHRKDGFTEIRVWDQPAAAGIGNYLDEPEHHVEQIPSPMFPQGAEFGIRISGNSMEPIISDSQTVFVRPCLTVDNGQIGVFVLNGAALCKTLVIDQDKQQIRLVSINPAYSDIVVGEQDTLRTIGQVIGVF